MIYLVDTNVLLRFVDRRHVIQPVLRAAIRALRAGGHHLRTATQNYTEFWNVATRPVSANGFGLSISIADQQLARIERLFPSLPDSPAVYLEWRHLVVAFGVTGVQVHDAKLVATMKVHGIDRILTLNTQDFGRYHSLGIVAVDPASV